MEYCYSISLRVSYWCSRLIVTYPAAFFYFKVFLGTLRSLPSPSFLFSTGMEEKLKSIINGRKHNSYCDMFLQQKCWDHSFVRFHMQKKYECFYFNMCATWICRYFSCIFWYFMSQNIQHSLSRVCIKCPHCEVLDASKWRKMLYSTQKKLWE